MSQEELDLELLIACNQGKLEKVKSLVKQGANVNACVKGHKKRAIMYALDNCNSGDPDTDEEKIVAFLVHSGADVNFTHGDDYRSDSSDASFMYWAAQSRASDDLIRYLIYKGKGYKTLNHIPTTKIGQKLYDKSALDCIKETRKELYEELVELNKGITSAPNIIKNNSSNKSIKR